MRLFNRSKKKETKQDSQQLAKPTIKESIQGEAGIYGNAGVPQYNPDDLVGRKGHDIYKKMMRDDAVKPAMRFKQAAVAGRKYSFIIGTDEDGKLRQDHQDISDFFNYVLQKMKGSFSDVLLNILSALEDGFVILEKNPGIIEWHGKAYWGLKSIKKKPAETFDITVDKYDNTTNISQSYAGGEDVPLEKVLHFVYQGTVNPIFGESDLRAAYRGYWSKDIVIRFQNIHLERMAGGFHAVELQEGWTDDIEKTRETQIKKFLKNISSRMGGLLPQHAKLKSVPAVQTSAYKDAITGYNMAISRAILVPSMTGLSDQIGTGSYAQSKIHMESFFFVLDRVAKGIEELLNENLFAELARWNFGTDDFPPFQFEPLSTAQKEAAAKIWGDMVSKGAVTKTPADEAHIRKLLGFPEAEIEAETPEIEEPDQEIKNHTRKYTDSPWMRRVDFIKADRTFDRDKLLADDLSEIMYQVRLSIEKQIKLIVGDKAFENVPLSDFQNIAISKKLKASIRKVLREHLSEVMGIGYELARKELPKRNNIIQPGMDITQAEKFLSSRAMTITGVINNDILRDVQSAVGNGIRYNKSMKEVMVDIRDTDLLAALPQKDAAGRIINVKHRIENIGRTNTADAFSRGREALFNHPDLEDFITAFQYSAVLDDRIADICEHLDGKIRKDFGSWSPPNHYMCRSMLVAVTIVDDWDGKESAAPRIKPLKGFYSATER